MRKLSLMRKDFQRLADLRAKEAGVLADSGNEQGAYYLAGYAVECALKACISKKTRRHEFPDKDYAYDVYTHNVDKLLKLAKLDKQMEKDMRNNPALAANWGVVRGWSEDSRYVASGLKGTDLHAAISGTDGVLAWIKQRW
jgi:HEPN domain-containing protein